MEKPKLKTPRPECLLAEELKGLIEETLRLFEDEGIVVKFYYLRSRVTQANRRDPSKAGLVRRPVVTVAMVKETYENDDGETRFRFHRGFALCHPLDNPWRLRGKAVALRNLFEATHPDKDTVLVKRISDEALEVLRNVLVADRDGADFFRTVHKGNFRFAFGEVNTAIIQKEYRIFEGKTEEEDPGLLCPEDVGTATGHYDPSGPGAEKNEDGFSDCAGCGAPRSAHRKKEEDTDGVQDVHV